MNTGHEETQSAKIFSFLSSRPSFLRGGFIEGAFMWRGDALQVMKIAARG
jgi:hypothetical protein